MKTIYMCDAGRLPCLSGYSCRTGGSFPVADEGNNEGDA